MKRVTRSVAAALLVLTLLPHDLSALPTNPAGAHEASAPHSASACRGAHPVIFSAGSHTRKLNIPLLISLEWNTYGVDALGWWQAAMKRAAQFLEDATGRQATIGRVLLVDNACRWADADVRVYAHNTGIPDAAVGGIAPQTVKRMGGKPANAAVFERGSIHLGRTWSEFGPLRGRWSDPDGFRTIVHELGHYAFYLYDEYFRYDDSNPNDPRPVAFCTKQRYFPKTSGSARLPLPDDPRAASIMYWEYSTHRFWNGSPTAGCHHTLQWQRYGRSDWQVISQHYPRLTTPSRRFTPSAWAACPVARGRSVCAQTAAHRWLLGVAKAPGLQGDGYLIKSGGTRALHEGAAYPDGNFLVDALHSVPPPREGLSPAFFPPYKLEILGGSRGDVVRVTGVYSNAVDPQQGDTWQADTLLSGSAGKSSLNQRPPHWYTNFAGVPLVDAMPRLSGEARPGGGLVVSGLEVRASDPLGAKGPYGPISATLFEAGGGPDSIPRSATAVLGGGGTIRTGLLDLKSPPILDGSLYFTPLVEGRPLQPPDRPDQNGGTAWALDHVSVACNSRTSYMPAYAPQDEGGLASADGVADVHPIGMQNAFCAGFVSQLADLHITSQLPGTNGTVVPLTAAYAIRGLQVIGHSSWSVAANQVVPRVRRLPSSATGAVVTLHYDRSLVPGNERPEIVRFPLTGGGGPSRPRQFLNPETGEVTAYVSALDAVYQVVLPEAPALNVTSTPTLTPTLQSMPTPTSTPEATPTDTPVSTPVPSPTPTQVTTAQPTNTFAPTPTTRPTSTPARGPSPTPTKGHQNGEQTPAPHRQPSHDRLRGPPLLDTLRYVLTVPQMSVNGAQK